MGEGRLALVTGAPGWAGDRLLASLVDPHPQWPATRAVPRYGAIRCLVAPGATRTAGPDVEVVPGDLRDPAAVARFTASAQDADLFHFAGLVHPRLRVRDLHAVNDLGTRILLAHAASAGVRRVVALSSNSAVGVSRDPGTLFREDSPRRPYLAYGRSKAAMEDAVRASAIDAVILRPLWFYGPAQPERQTVFFRMVRDGKAPLVGGGRARRSLSYTDSIALAALLAATVPEAAGRTYWIADARPYPMAEIVDTIEAVLAEDFGIKVTGGRLRLPSVAADGACLIDHGLQRAGLYQQKIHVLGEMNKTIACSIARARDELGYTPGPGLREGMRRSVQWCLDNGRTI